MSLQTAPVEQDQTVAHFDAVVVGAGFSGLYMVHRLRDELGLSVRGYEAANGVGGTWYWNRYPGAQTDSLHSVYQFTFSPAISAEWTFSSRYPSQGEVLEYLNFVADRLDLRSSFQFGSRVAGASFDEKANHWTIEIENGETVTAQFLITGVGLLSAPNRPDFPGLDSFRGDVLHSAVWPTDGVDLSGKRVALIGTGSTGIQILPQIAGDAAHVTVLQRTPNYVVPAHNRRLTDEEKDAFRAEREQIARRVRKHPFAMDFTSKGLNALEVDADTRHAVYEEAWNKGGFYFLFETFDDLQIDEAANETACEFIRAKIREIVKDPQTAETLTPRNYPYGAKRPPAGTHYYETFNRPNVDLVDLRKTPIVEITPDGVRTEAGDHSVDVIIMATGFDASTGSLTRIDIRGRDGQRLADRWAEGPITNLGFNTSGFPNLLMITGPLSPFANIPTCIEETSDWIVNCIKHLREHNYTHIESNPAAEQAWADHVTEIANMIVTGKGEAVNTWFAGANIAGKSNAINVYFGGANAYFAKIRETAAEGYTGFSMR
ncbi:flavin-containing monooxygenase [Gordonia sp. C13]|uniref:flavin-containing monooxygenase n=1 Tax=Gordonia sp. C13 TaxID=2935078 RepID=UPI00200A4BC9|nr:NAD(P)/FAD-dependent oxidoreductase [Gordonia sp. C13]MCK8616673.1 NAD(P)/FAD-dependent oxidoreductase [Gordonia sp. C13]